MNVTDVIHSVADDGRRGDVDEPAALSARLGEGSSVISFEDVSKRFGRKLAVHGVHMDVKSGEFLCIVGPSGCGKSTLLNMVSGLHPVTSGIVLYNGEPVSGPNRNVGYITQKDLLLPWRTVTANVRLPLELRGWSRQRSTERVQQVLDMVGLTEARAAYPYQLSGGMRKRVAIARVLAYEPKVLLMDEPFGSLDAQLRLQMHDELLRIWAHQGSTVVFVTHDLSEAITLADRIVVMTGSPGHVTLEVPVEIDRPRRAAAIQTHPRYAAIFSQLWEAIGGQANSTKAPLDGSRKHPTSVIDPDPS